MFLWFLDIFPVFDEFFPNCPSHLSIITFFSQFDAKLWKYFWELFCSILCYEWQKIKGFIKIFIYVGMKNREVIGIVLFQREGNWNFWPKYLPSFFTNAVVSFFQTHKFVYQP